ncbi:MAG TPA: hypothetical protein PKD10_09015 [Paracoccaceae bacterium]|nr:hypothetical protein [Paracoccaceae bacterium]HMO70210.1 hypothetical protein [Paracoccaceae bacterium]
MKALLPILLALLPAAAGAQDLARCYLRDYTPDHLAGHPLQVTQRIALGPSDWAPPGGWGADGPPAVLRLHLATRDGRRFSTLVFCRTGAPGHVCSVDGEGGHLTLEPAQGGAVMLRPRAPGIFLIDDTSGEIEISATRGDDRAFRLPPVPADACP